MINLIFMAFRLRSSLAASDAARPAPPVHFTNFDRSAKGWATWSPRAEIAPKFAVNATGGRAGGGALSIACAKPAEFGAWRTVVSGIEPASACLPEWITVVGNGKTYGDVCELVAGRTTRPLGEAAKRLNSYTAGGIYERVGPVIYNTAVLVGRDGKLVGTFRNTRIPREE